MDEFGVLVESIGFKAHGKSAPMAKSKPKPKSSLAANTTPFNDSTSLPVDELDGIFRSNLNIHKNPQSQNLLGDDDIFGGHVSSGEIGLESVLNSSSNRVNNINLDPSNYVGVNSVDDLLGSQSGQSDSVNDLLGSQPQRSDSVDDLMGGSGVNSSGRQENKRSELDDLIPGFGGASPTNKRVESKTALYPESSMSNLSSTLGDDPFLGFESSVAQSDAFAGEEDVTKDPIQSTLDELDDFAMGRDHNNAKSYEKRTAITRPSAGTTSSGFENVHDLDTFFSGGVQQKHAVPTSTSQGSQLDILGEGKRSEWKQTSSGSSSGKTTTSATNLEDNFTALFGDIATSSGEFQEVEGEPEERRRARLNRHMRMNARMADALAEKNQRDLQSQNEQEEKYRLAETLDNDIKCWAAGKEGNLRALLSSLQLVLWPECGWVPVSLTDMITSDSVKKVYKKATLYVHPDKVQQKGASLHQKYVAEKVFDLLKEAWNKFSAEELG